MHTLLASADSTESNDGKSQKVTMPCPTDRPAPRCPRW